MQLMSVSTDCCCVVITIIEWTRIMWSGLNGQCYEQFRVDSLLRKVMKKRLNSERDSDAAERCCSTKKYLGARAIRQ